MKDFGIERIGRVYRERAIAATPPRAVIGLEAEFHLFVNGRRRRPEKVFGDPSRLVRQRMIPRTGKSFQLPAGGAIYFDTGVIEVATRLLLSRHALALGTNPLFASGGRSLGEATQLPVPPPRL